jgi:hypothetical protein
VKPVLLQPAAEADLGDAYRWYENQRLGLGAELLVAATAAKNFIAERPEA